MLRRLYANHVLANLTFLIVLAMGFAAYFTMPREQDPEINFNWIDISTVLPGASAEDVEKLITEPLEEAVAKISDVRFVSSNSREGVSSILVRFNEIDTRTFDKRVNDLRREIQNKANAELPAEAEDPYIFEITTSNSFPTALVVVSGQADDERLRATAQNVKEDLERLQGVDKVNPAALHDPELRVEFDARQLRDYGVAPVQLAETVRAHFRDVSAGSAEFAGEEWLVRVLGAKAEPDYVAGLPIITARGEVPVGALAQVSTTRSEPEQLVRYEGRPAVLLAVNKKGYTNTLELVERLKAYIERQNAVTGQLGVRVVLLDDQTAMTRNALRIMQSNALLGLLLVTAVAWVFLGSRIALFVGLGIPFALAGTFWVLGVTGQTVNVSVLLGLVMVLGMLVDDAVVVVEAIYYRLQRGAEAMQAAVDSLREVFAPVTASVLTTVAAFLPLMLMPGIVGRFMFVVPFVVTVALLISLLEAYWMLPVHISMARVSFARPSRVHRHRVRFTHWLTVKYGRALVWVLRRPKTSLLAALLLLVSAVGMVASGAVKVQFFAFDAIRLFYINVEMPPGTPLDETLRVVQAVEDKARTQLRPEETRGLVSAAGQMFTETEPFFGDRYGQVTVALQPKTEALREVDEIIEAMRATVVDTAGPSNIAFLRLSGGPPTSKPIKVKVRGDDFAELRAVTDRLRSYLATLPAAKDISDDDSPGKEEWRLQLDTDAVKRAGINPAELASTLRLLFDGEVVASMQHQGEKLEVRVRGQDLQASGVDAVLGLPIALRDGGSIPLGELVKATAGIGKGNIRHYNFRRAITLEADLDKAQMDTVEVNRLLAQAWEGVRGEYPGVDLDFSGELDDIQESLDALIMLFILGLGLIYLILGTQFRSYFQPLMILVTVPLAFAGVVYGLALTQNPLSLFTMYGVVALAGVAVNSAIVMIDAANRRLEAGMSVLHAAVYAARRRLIPILITSLTTIAGLLSLALGIGGKSLLWGPVASAIVWGLMFSTLLTLFVIPLLYRTFMGRARVNLPGVTSI